jgi:adenylyltransferase/sulfurtransferase
MSEPSSRDLGPFGLSMSEPTESGHPQSLDLDADELRRYGRQMILPELGREGQLRLKKSRVLVVGAGGLGSPALAYLAAAGVGALGVVDFDEVDPSNLHRQLLYESGDVGRSKLEVARERLNRINPHVRIELHAQPFGPSNARELVSRYDVIVDGSDNFPTRYAVNDACVLCARPNVHAAVQGFEGQISVFAAVGGPCYRCLFPEPPPAGSIPSCAESGVLGVLPAILGSLQANETLKLLLGVGEPLIGRLLIFDALRASGREIRLRPDPACEICGEEPSLQEVRPIEVGCQPPSPDVQSSGRRDRPDRPPESVGDTLSITVEELDRRLRQGDAPLVLDVRLEQELALAPFPGALHIPLHTLPQQLALLDSESEIAVLCHHGVRSLQAVYFLRAHGFPHSRNLEGGIDLWAARIDPSVPRY